MLVLSRDCDTVVHIGPDIKVKVLSIRKQRVKLGVDAPEHIRVWREEIDPDISVDHRRPPASKADFGQLPILVIEDDPAHAELIARALEDNGFSRVNIVSTGGAAMELLGRGAPTDAVVFEPYLILLDFYLPDIPGLEVLRYIRSVPRFCATPVVVLSAEDRDATVMSCLEAGANAYVTKSARYSEFRQAVSRIVSFWGNACRVPRRAVEASP